MAESIPAILRPSCSPFNHSGRGLRQAQASPTQAKHAPPRAVLAVARPSSHNTSPPESDNRSRWCKATGERGNICSAHSHTGSRGKPSHSPPREALQQAERTPVARYFEVFLLTWVTPVVKAGGVKVAGHLGSRYLDRGIRFARQPLFGLGSR